MSLKPSSEHRAQWKIPRKMSLIEWADEHFYLSAESAAIARKWTTLSYQRGIMDAMNDPDIEMVSVQKSSQIGATKMLCAKVGYHIDHDPCSMTGSD